ncbi:MAG: ABC transporter ATP-binding protein [Desulfurococcales archaeon]|nr:ABC transporter ATP-binding protein [Desulfurococcales archaeon]
MTSIELRNVTNYALKNISVKIGSGEFYVLIGPNGAGKTTLLKVIAGLVDYRGTVLFDGEPVDSLPPEKRNIGYVPQSIALFPHMTVEENILVGLRTRGYSIDRARAIAREYIKLTGITGLENKYPLKLSGGERKKAAIARALAINPRILLLDEPFDGIQYGHRIEIAEIIRYINRELGKTIILVTHNIDEALNLGKSFGIIDNGKLLFSGSKQDFAEKVSKYIKYINTLECNVEQFIQEGIAKTNCNGLKLLVPIDHVSDYGNKKRHSRIRILIPADKIVVSDTLPRPALNTVKARVIEEHLISKNTYMVKLDTGSLLINAVTRSKVGYGEVYLKIPMRYMYIVE